jgi:hypothetical protein
VPVIFFPAFNRTGEGYLLQGNQLTDADLTIAPGTDKCSLYGATLFTRPANPGAAKIQ